MKKKRNKEEEEKSESILVGKGGEGEQYDTLAMKVSREGAWTVSWGRAFQSFMCYGQCGRCTGHISMSCCPLLHLVA